MIKLSRLRHIAVFLTVFLVFSQAVFLLPINADTNDTNIAIISPTPYSSIYGLVNVRVEAYTNYPIDKIEFSWSGGTYGSVEIDVGGTDISGGLNIYNYDWDVSALANGYYDLKVTAYSGSIVLGESVLITVNIDKSLDTSSTTVTESVSFVTPQAGEEIYGQKEIVVDVQPGVYSIDKVMLNFAGASRLMAKDQTSGYYTYTLDTASYANGTLNLLAVVDWNHNSKPNSDFDINVIINNQTTPGDTTTPPETDVPANVNDNTDSSAAVTPTVRFLNKPDFIEGPVTLSAEASFSTTEMGFAVHGPLNKTYTGIPAGTNMFKFSWEVVKDNFPEGNYTLEASAIHNGTVYRDALDVVYSVENFENPEEEIFIPEPTKINFVEIPLSPLSGTKKIAVVLSKEVEKVEFLIEGPVTKKITGAITDPMNYYILWETNNGSFPDGSYKVTAGAIVAGEIKAREYFTTILQNTIQAKTEDLSETQDTQNTEPITITIAENIISPISGSKTITVITSQIVDSVNFKILGPTEKSYIGQREDDYHYFFVWPTGQFRNGYYKLSIIATKGAVNQTKSISLEINNQLNEGSESGLLTPNTQVKTEPILDECRTAGINDPEACKLFLSLPLDCQMQGIKNKTECDIFVSIPIKCREKNLSLEECNNYLSLPLDCRQQNITTLQECNRYLFQKALPTECRIAEVETQEECRDLIIKRNLPQACLEASANTYEECDAYLTETNQEEGVRGSDDQSFINIIPAQCQAAGITDTVKCDTFIKEKNLSPQCRENGIYDMNGCSRFIFDKYGPSECLKINITSQKECEGYLFNKYIQQISCENKDVWECNKEINNKYLGTVVFKQAQFDELKEKIDTKAGEVINTKKFKDALIKSKELVPVVEGETNLKIITTKERMVLNDEELVQTSPMAVMIDSDGDGLPDDIEARLGTDPGQEDTDSDGYSDYLEVKNGYNPLGEGKYDNSTMSEIERAILNNGTLEHPKTEGKLNSGFKINNVVNKENADENQKGYVFSGTAEPNSVLTLYIYSDLPVVTTVSTNEFGNWEYQFTKSLVEGEHEVYIALNDNTGKVVSKSTPLNFFVKEARAVSLDDFLATASVEAPQQTEAIISIYLIVSIAVIVLGIFIFVIMLSIYKNRQQV